MKLRLALAALALATLVGAAPVTLDSEYVLQRYAIALASLSSPKVVVYSYTVAQIGPKNIEQHHEVYRSGMEVRDEILAVDGIALTRKVVHFSRHAERYTVDRFAPRSDAYELLFLGTAKDGHHFDYVYEATPLSHPSGAWIDRIAIDGLRFLPRAVHFHSSGLGAVGSASIEFGAFGNYWMPVVISAQARVKGKPARERIVWSDYRFPENLPPATFQAPEPLPERTPSP